MFAPWAEANGWHYNKRLNVYQQVRGKAFVYVSPLLFGYKAQLYMRGYRNMMSCRTEIRTTDRRRESLEKMFDVSEVWLYHYFDGELDRISNDFYAIDNPNGAWGIHQSEEKLFLI